MNLEDLKTMYVTRSKRGIDRLVLLPRVQGTKGDASKPVWIDLRMDPLTAGEYRIVRAWLHKQLAPVALQVRKYAPDWADLTRSDGSAQSVTIEQLYDALAPRIVNWSYSIRRQTEPPSVSKTPYAVMAWLDDGVLLNVSLYLLRRSEVVGKPPTGESVA